MPDDFEDHDLQASPISASIGGIPVIVTGGKVGYVYELNAWKTPVGEHNGHDDDSLLALSHKLNWLPTRFRDPTRMGGRQAGQLPPEMYAQSHTESQPAGRWRDARSSVAFAVPTPGGGPVTEPKDAAMRAAHYIIGSGKAGG